MGTTPSESQYREADAAPAGLRVFINYRHHDIGLGAQLLYERLADRFGGENVFLDARSLQPGVNWLESIKSHRASCDVLLALIGPRWISIMKDRDHAALATPADDYVRLELQYALKAESGIRVIPVLVGDDVPFVAEALPMSLRALARIEAAQVRPKLLDQDIAHLISQIEAIAREQPSSDPEPVRNGGNTNKVGAAAPQPDATHWDLVLKQFVNEGNLVLFLGPRLPTGHPGPPDAGRRLGDSEEIAASLARRFGIERSRLDLPQVAQYVYVTMGRSDLCRELRQLLTAECEPGPVHRFLARLPGTLKRLHADNRYQLIVTTNFDRSLEQAFDEEGEPYDLAVYMASGRDQGKFVHFPPDEGVPKPIADPNSYTELPIGLDYELERTVIVKIHGAVDGKVGNYRWRENYVVTEDHYIDYLSKSPIESLVPVQVLDKLRESHCLFLGYTMRDWNLRVFLKRIWEGSLGARSWAVEPDPDILEKDFWAQSNVDLYAADLADYVGQLQGQLAARKLASDKP